MTLYCWSGKISMYRTSPRVCDDILETKDIHDTCMMEGL